ncbi:MAG: ABC transporter substrate-binding protein [Anaerolineales bacterium]|nr:ABC transporter substrate-binding protein [Anaerolineales bacterium]
MKIGLIKDLKKEDKGKMNAKASSLYRMMRVMGLVLLAAITVFFSACKQGAVAPTEAELVPLTLQLQWVTQAQFAGYYVALDKGWYAEEGINLAIEPGGPDLISTDRVISGASDFGTALLADVMVAIESGKSLVSISQIQQRNGLLLIAMKDSGIAGPQDFAGKKVGVWLGNWEAQFDALIAKEGIGTDTFELVSQGFSMDAFIDRELDVASAMIYNEYYVVLESGIGADQINIIDYADYGLDFPGDVLFTSSKMAEENPDICMRMVRASLRGWQYAIDHPEEAADIVLKYDESGLQTREHQLSMMQEIAKLVQVSVRPLGYTDRADIRRVIDTLYNYGVLNSLIEPEDVFNNTFWEQAQQENP